MAEKHLTDGTTALAAQPRIIKIEAAEKPENARLRVAAYTRVSSDSDDQLNSFAAQNRYYAELISGKAEWRMVDIYADEGITGTSAAKREDFQRMMADCRRGLIDQILVKSISRFARNTKDCLEAVRELKELGVNVRFEREGIDIANVSSELITAIYAAFAQKESESISGNMRWSYQRRMESGEFNTCRAPWGFRLDGKSLAVHEDEAEIVRRIFLEYLSGRNPREIAEILNAEDTSGRIWKYKAVDYILQNEIFLSHFPIKFCLKTGTYINLAPLLTLSISEMLLTETRIGSTRTPLCTSVKFRCGSTSLPRVICGLSPFLSLAKPCCSRDFSSVLNNLCK